MAREDTTDLGFQLHASFQGVKWFRVVFNGIRVNENNPSEKYSELAVFAVMSYTLCQCCE